MKRPAYGAAVTFAFIGGLLLVAGEHAAAAPLLICASAHVGVGAVAAEVEALRREVHAMRDRGRS